MMGEKSVTMVCGGDFFDIDFDNGSTVADICRVMAERKHDSALANEAVVVSILTDACRVDLLLRNGDNMAAVIATGVKCLRLFPERTWWVVGAR